MLHPLTKEIRTKIREAVKEFGSYSYGDKGPHEVMEVGELVDKLKALPEDELRKVHRELNKTEHGEIFVDYVCEPFEKIEDADPTAPAPVLVVGLNAVDDFIKSFKKK